MKAYMCDNCGNYFQGLPAGVFYDNREDKEGNKTRTDLCTACTKLLADTVHGEAEVPCENE